MKICPTCQKTYPDDFSLCPRDGARLAAQATETEAQLAAGLSGRFRIVRRLGAGAMGTVFLAEQLGVGNRPVALKVLNRKLLDDPEFLLRFQNEAGSTGRIHHQNVVTIHESGQADDGTPYIAMEFLEGESLREVIKQRGALPVTEVMEILQQAARGLSAAHRLGIIHRDLKPDNLFLTHSDEGELVVKVVDFGIAKLRESPMHTQTGMVLGTPAYMSSEQAYGMRSDELDARSDVYSLDSRVTGTTSWDRHMRHCIRRVSELLAKTVAESLARRRLR
ncbi:MAG: serine/threonine-protein kinase [Terriglobia bacterium]|jgi:serine/threonine-protein kinase